MTRNEAAVPSQHGLGTNDQESGSVAGAFHCGGEHREDRAVGVSELRPADLALQHQDLVAEGEDLGVASIAGGEHPPESRQNEACQSREEGHEGRTLPSDPPPRTLENPGRMSIRPPHGYTKNLTDLCPVDPDSWAAPSTS